jgi:hypothetical protein
MVAVGGAGDLFMIDWAPISGLSPVLASCLHDDYRRARFAGSLDLLADLRMSD